MHNLEREPAYVRNYLSLGNFGKSGTEGLRYIRLSLGVSPSIVLQLQPVTVNARVGLSRLNLGIPCPLTLSFIHHLHYVLFF